MRRILSLITAVCGLGAFLVAPVSAQNAPESPWRLAAESSLPQVQTERVLAPRTYRTWSLDVDALQSILSTAPPEGIEPNAETVLALPMPDGRLARFRIEDSPIMAPELAARLPEIRTYRGQGIDDPTAIVRFDWTPEGFHAMVLSEQGTIFVDPWGPGVRHLYVSYDKKGYSRETPPRFRCHVTGDLLTPDQLDRETRALLREAVAAGEFTKRTYRLALAATGEYTSHFGNQTKAITAITTTMNRVNAIYQNDLTITLQLFANEQLIVFTDPATDPYTGTDIVSLVEENPVVLDMLIGSASYDIGHVFTISDGGISGLGVVCKNGSKAQGVTGSTNPVGDPFDVDYVAHEMGHQFGANHTFNGTTGACGNMWQRHEATAMEPGSASTVMGYAGICGAQDLQAHSDDYFHAVSIEEITAYVGTQTCHTASSPGHSRPSVAAANFTIPRQTPFTLTATGYPNDSDSLTYAWEEFDTGSPSPPDTDVSAVRPIFRSFLPSASPSRTFPRLSDILANTTTYGESLPNRSRLLRFRVTARDNHVGAGGTDYAEMGVTVDTSGPFKVTSPNTAVGWGIGTTQTVTWNVAGTSVPLVSCANVRMLLSADGGNTFPTELLASTTNDGSAAVTVPNVVTNQARIKIDSDPCSNVFFEISDANFTIAPLVTLTPTTVAVAEGNSGTTPLSFTVTMAPASSQTVTVSYATASGTVAPAAAAGSDFVAAAGTLTFTPGVTTQTFSVSVKGDTMYERDETFTVSLTAASGAIISSTAKTATVTIQNDDAPPTVSINDVTALEGNAGTKNFVFTATLSAASGVPATVAWATADGTATVANNDYRAGSGTLTFTAGVVTRTLAVAVVGDLVFEGGPETFFVNLSSPVDVTIADGTGQGTILEDDSAGNFSFGAPSFTVSETATVATIRVIRTDGWAGGVSVDYVVSSGTATAGADFTTTSGTVTFAAYQTFTNFTVGIVRDTIDEPNETALLRLTNPVGPLAALGPQPTAVLNILDNDTGGKVQFGAAALTGNEAAMVKVTVRRIGGAANEVTVNYATADGTGVAGTDYVTASGTLSFGVGEVVKTFDVQTLAVAGPQGNRTVNLALSAPTGGAVLVAPSAAVLTITDDQPSIQFLSSAFLANEAALRATITLRRTGPLTDTVRVDYAMVPGGTATAGADYIAAAGTLEFAPRVAVKTFTVTLVPDTVTEPNETVFLQITANPPGSVGIGTAPGATSVGTAILTIKDNDPQQRFQFLAATYRVSEASARVAITVRRTGSTVGTVTVDYATSDGTTGTPATAADYTSASGTLTFAQGVAVQSFIVSILPDTLPEGTETVDLTLSNPTGGAQLGTPATAVLSILDNEPVFQLAVDRYAVSEKATKLIGAARRLGTLTGTVTVDWATSDGTATAGQDYAAGGGTLTFGPGVAIKTFQVNLTPDTVDEPNETFDLTLSNPQPAGTIGLGTPAKAVVTIADDDVAGKAQFGVAVVSVSEAQATATFTVTRIGGTSNAATVDYATSDGVTGGGVTGAVAGTDYTATSETLSFAYLEKTKTITVPIINVAGVQPNRYLNLTLSNPSYGVTLGVPSQTVLWIVDTNLP